VIRVEREIAGRTLSIETGRMANQAGGAATVQYGDTVVLVTACVSPKEDETRDFLPLFVEYREMTYAAGRIPGGFFKREGRPNEKEVLSSRLIDRPIRPLFPSGWRNEIQIVALVLSSDQENDSDILGMIGASAALVLSPIPFSSPIGAARIGKIGGQFVVNPTFQQLEESEMSLVVAGTRQAVTTIEGSAKEVVETDVMEAIGLAHDQIRQVIDMVEELGSKVPVTKVDLKEIGPSEEMRRLIMDLTRGWVEEAATLAGKVERARAFDGIVERATEKLAESYPDDVRWVPLVVEELRKEAMRRRVLVEGIRADNRGPQVIRHVTCQAGVLPRTHGSALFTRGQTQSLCVTTLGTTTDEQKIEDLAGESWKTFMLHYNFPPFSVGEVRPIRGPGRREVGHGALAERALESVLPSEEAFPYTIRIVSDILESNGSSSMATVCGGSLALMDAGVPVKAAVAGIAMGLITEEDQEILLTDIVGEEDHLGDMDFKVAGTRTGITAVQLDTKISGIRIDTIRRTLEQAREARHQLLDVMDAALDRPRPELSVYAPRLILIMIPRDKIGEVIGPGGKVIRSIQEQTGAKIEIEDDGKVTISSVDKEAAERAVEMVQTIVQDVEVGKTYKGTVKRITRFGAFVEILSKEGLVHISQLAPHRVERVEDVLKVGQEVMVKVIGIDDLGRIDLSRKALMRESEDESPRHRRSRHPDARRSRDRRPSGGR
jgi:polyribonucleotide nucleotidyltransferase